MTSAKKRKKNGMGNAPIFHIGRGQIQLNEPISTDHIHDLKSFVSRCAIDVVILQGNLYT